MLPYSYKTKKKLMEYNAKHMAVAHKIVEEDSFGLA